MNCFQINCYLPAKQTVIDDPALLIDYPLYSRSRPPGCAQAKAAAEGAVRSLVRLVEEGSPSAQEAAAWALGSLVMDSFNNQLKAGAEGALRPLILYLDTGKLRVCCHRYY